MQVSPVINFRRQAFTLVELMTSSVVLSMLVLMLSGAFSQVSRAWITSSGRIEQRSNSRALADFIGSELRGAQLPVVLPIPDPTTGKIAPNLRFVINPDVTELPDTYRNADAIFWQSPIATETSYGDTAEIGYYVQWIDTSAGSAVEAAASANATPTLCRFFVNPSATNGGTGVQPNPNFLLFQDPKKGAWLSDLAIQTAAPVVKNRGFAGLFAENVVGMWIRSFGLDGKEITEDQTGLRGGVRRFDSKAGYSATFPSTTPGDSAWKEKRYLPARVQISLVQMDSRTARNLRPVADDLRGLTRSTEIHNAAELLTQLRQTAPAGSAMAAILPGLRVYTTEVQLQNAR